jgi:hypothetical protein
MAIRYVGVNGEQKRQLKESQECIRDRISKNGEVIPRRLLFELQELLGYDTNTVVELRVRKLSPEVWAVTSDGLAIAPMCFRPWTPKSAPQGAKGSKSPKNGNPPRLTAVLLHELVHFAGGEELDAEFFENKLFTKAEGAILPTESDEQTFKLDEYRGRFIELNPKTREVTELGAERRGLGRLEMQPPVLSDPLKNETLFAKGLNGLGEGGDMSTTNQENLAQLRIDKMKERKSQVGIRVVVEITGYIKKRELGSLLDGIKRNVTPHVEGNGGGGQ